MPRAPWHDEAKRLALDGVSQREIARLIGRSEETVRRFFKGIGNDVPAWVPRARELRAGGMHYTDIARELHVSRSMVISYCLEIVPAIDTAAIGTRLGLERARAKLLANPELRKWKKPKQERKPRKRQERTPAEIREIERMRVFRRALTIDREKRNVPVTLPKLSFLQ